MTKSKDIMKDIFGEELQLGTLPPDKGYARRRLEEVRRERRQQNKTVRTTSDRQYVGPSVTDEERGIYDIDDVFKGVSMSWLRYAFRLELATVRMKLAKITPTRYDGHNKPVYDFVEAASVLVKPHGAIEDYLTTIGPKDLPHKLQKSFWDAKLQEQKYLERAGKLWHTDDVMAVFGDVFQHIRTTTMLWVGTLEREEKLSTKQIATINQLTDALMLELHDKLVSLQDTQRTENSIDRDEEAEAENNVTG